MQSKRKPRSSKKYALSVLFLLLLMAITYYFVFRSYSFIELLDILKEVDKSWILLSIGFVIIFISGQGLSIKLICKSLGHKISFPASFVYSSIDFYYSSITPSATGGQPMMAYYMSKDGVPLSRCGIALVLTVMQYTLSIVVLGIAGMFILPDFISQATSHTLFVIFYFIGILLNLALVLACVAAMFWRSLASKFIVFLANLFSKIRIIKDKESVINNFQNVLNEYNDAAHYVKNHPLIVLRVFFINLLQRTALFSISYFVYRSFGFSSANYFELVAAQAMVTISVSILPLPGAVGASEGMFMLMFGKFYGESYLMPAMFLTRGITFYFMLIFNCIITWINHFRVMLRKES